MGKRIFTGGFLGGNMKNIKNIITPEEVVMGLPVGLTVFYYEDGIHVLYVSEEAGRILGYSVPEYIDFFENCIDRIFEDKLQEFENELRKLTPGCIPLNYTIYSPNKQRQYRWINLCVSVEEREGHRVYYLVSKDISGLKETLDKKSSTDALTGVLNRRAFEEQYNYKLKTFKNSEEHAFILIDIDDFKIINDTYGHQQGDKVICKVAHVLKKSFREDDLVARLGGDEFAIIFWDIKSRENIKKRMEIIFNYLADDEKQLNYSISISIGITCFEQGGGTFENMYSKADSELYKVKRNDKGRYSIAD